ncbi:MAG: lmo0937 family membrane protein [Candidatus Angelobacter sp.]|jgi:hypothetical protein
MLWGISVVFFILWILGLASVVAVGAWIWLFFVIWIVALIAQMATRHSRRPAPPRAI